MPFKVLKHILFNRLALSLMPSYCTFMVTWRCNLRCMMCHIWQKKERREEELRAEEVGEIFSQLDSLDVVRISGGEPFLRDDLMEIVMAIEEKARPSTIVITTNATLKERMLAFLREYKPMGARLHLRVSLDAIGEAHDRIRGVEGAYERSMETLMELKELHKKQGFYLGINQTISKENLHHIMPLIELSEQLGLPLHHTFALEDLCLYRADSNTISPGLRPSEFKDTYTKEQLQEAIKGFEKAPSSPDPLVKMLNKYFLRGMENRALRDLASPRPPCVALTSHLRLMPNGDVVVCIYDPTVVGNLKEKDFKALWFGEKIAALRQRVRKCPGCWAGCEVGPNAFYSGDILRALFY